MNEVRRHSPVSFEPQPVQTEARSHWSVALKYPHEGGGPHLVDLSHKPKWDVQSSAIDTIQSFGVEIPKAPGPVYTGERYIGLPPERDTDAGINPWTRGK